jgi:hypothetical protein
MTVYFIAAIIAWWVTNRRWLKRRQFTLGSLLVLTTLIAAGMAIPAFFDVSLCSLRSDPAWSCGTQCEKSWVDDSNDNLPRRHGLPFRGDHTWEYKDPWDPQFRNRNDK